LTDTASKHREQKKFDRLLERLQAKLPSRLARVMSWLLGPSGMFVRLPLGVLCIVGGIFSFLPLLGIWMLPLGILLIAVDVPPVRRRVVQVWPKIEARWRLLRTRRKRRVA
jgi:hypothetical protein